MVYNLLDCKHLCQMSPSKYVPHKRPPPMEAMYISCQVDGKICYVGVPWSDKTRFNFTTAKNKPMNTISRLVKEHDTQLGQIIHYDIDHTTEAQDPSHLTMMDEHQSPHSPTCLHNYR